MPSRSGKEEDPGNLETRCPRLGGTVPFRYCLSPGEPDPCFKILDCWWESFDVSAYLESHFPEQVLEGLFQGRNRPNRLSTILDLVEKFKSSKKPGEESR